MTQAQQPEAPGPFAYEMNVMRMARTMYEQHGHRPHKIQAVIMFQCMEKMADRIAQLEAENLALAMDGLALIDAEKQRQDQAQERQPLTPDELEAVLRESAKHGASLKPDEQGQWFKRSEVLAACRAVERVAAQRAAEACADFVVNTKEWRGRGWVCTICPATADNIAAALRARGAQGEQS